MIDFQEGNKLYQEGQYEQAAAYYIKAILKQPSFYSSSVNLALALRKIENKKISDQLLKELLSGLRPNSVEQDLILLQRSGLFNTAEYEAEHAFWLLAGIDPTLHYLGVGWQLGFNPSQYFDSEFYINQFAKKIQDNEIPILHYLSKGKKKADRERSTDTEVLAHLSAQLWHGHSLSALKALKAIYTDESVSESARWEAMWQTARWLYFCGEMQQALAFSNKMQQLRLADVGRKESVYLKFFCLLSLKRNKEAYAELETFRKKHPVNADTQFALANAIESDEERIEQINHAFALHGFAGIARKDQTTPLSLSNIIGLPIDKVMGDKKISIIMPIYNAAEQVGVAIESLLAQTYKNIEIIAVDDCSSDHTFKVLQELVKQDSRVKAVQPAENGGAYAARNYGLKFVTGDLITTHDSDDWSHPQKIETQVNYLEKNPHVMGCVVHWARVQANLAFTQNWRPSDALIHWSHSSFMFRREVWESLGEWDQVRIGGDTEYIWRMQASFGKAAFTKIHAEIPLAFALDEESSLTRTKATHVRTVYFGLRHIYRQIYVWWHKYKKDLYLTNTQETRRFPAPRSVFSSGAEALVFDNVIAGDFSRLTDTQKAAAFIGKFPQRRVALLHWPDFNKAPESLCNLYFELLYQNRAEPIVMGQRVEARSHKITDKELIHYPLDGYPDWVSFQGWEPL